jgi:hypothetical protein
MRRVGRIVGLMCGTLLSYTARSFAGDEACTLLTQTQVSAALEIPVDGGTPLGRPSACQWTGKGRFATLTITQPLAGKSAVDRFNAGKRTTIPGITTEPVGGVGDEAYYVYFRIRRLTPCTSEKAS